MSKTKVYLCSFASNDLNLSVKRFIKQANQLNFYEDIKVYKPQDFSIKLRNRIKDYLKLEEGIDIMVMMYGDQR